MLKKIRGLFLGLVVLAGSACVTPTHASSAQNVVISYIQAAGSSGAKEELIVLHNNSMQDVDITGWCLENKAHKLFACFDEFIHFEDEAGIPMLEQRAYRLPAYGDAVIASSDYVDAHLAPPFDQNTYTLIYTVTSQSSGSIVSSTDSIQLVDAQAEIVDSRGWTSTLSREKAWARLKILPFPVVYATSGSEADWALALLKESVVSDVVIESFISVDESVDGQDGDKDIGQPYQVESPIRITELLPNPAGVDAGKEFIEFYNTADGAVVLEGYAVVIGCGESKNTITLPQAITIQQGEYYVLTNEVVDFTLANTQGCVQLTYHGSPIGESIEYSNAKDDNAWAFIGETWAYTSTLTPGLPNQPSAVLRKQAATQSEKKPCADNQFRNPETGRCKLISATTSSLTPCKVGQERNSETGRCRAVKQTTQTPCKEGQFRNPETGRCKGVTKMSNADHAVKGVQSSADNRPQWYYWVGLMGVIMLVLGYAVWEWREEFRQIARKLKAIFAGSAR